jgi:hypothetical protein
MSSAATITEEQRIVLFRTLTQSISAYARALEQASPNAPRTGDLILCQECGACGSETRHCHRCNHETKKVHVRLTYNM